MIYLQKLYDLTWPGFFPQEHLEGCDIEFDPDVELPSISNVASLFVAAVDSTVPIVLP